MDDLNYSNMSEKLLEVVPELRPRYEEEWEWWQGEIAGPHIVYGDVLNPYLESLLDSETDKATLERIFAFLERLAVHEDPEVQGVVENTVCKALLTRKNARRYMGPATRSLSEQAERS